MQNNLNAKLKNNKIINLIGKIFGSLTVIEFAYVKNGSAHWICKCACGNITKPKAGNDLNRRGLKSCGEGLCNRKIINLIGQKFNKLTVIERHYTKNGKVYWICRCDCGKITKPISGDNLKGQHPTKSCGDGICNGKIKNIEGLIFGNIEIIGFSHTEGENGSFWIGKCIKCDRETRPTALEFIQSGKKQCEDKFCSGKIYDLVGNVYNFLKVLKFGGIKGKSTTWICECLLCGKITNPIRSSHLKFGATKTCGCCKNVKETQTKNIIEKIYVDRYNILQGHRPIFLKNQHLDIVLVDKTTGDYFLAIERDGEQHKEPVSFGGMSKKQAEKQFRYIQKMDAKKNRAMEKNKNIIPYFIRIGCDEKITEENIIRILVKYNVPVPHEYVRIEVKNNDRL